MKRKGWCFGTLVVCFVFSIGNMWLSVWTSGRYESGAKLNDEMRGKDWFLHDDTYTKSRCLSSLRRNPEKLPSDVTFIRDIPVLMWDEHITPDEYGRLKQFYPPYGWKNVPIEDINNSLRHFNTSAHRYMFAGWTPDHDGCIRCAVVGNGGILRGSGKGREIDGHDFVFRTNGAIIEGFEEDAGKRTSFYFHTFFTMKVSLQRAKKYGFKHLPQDKETVYVVPLSAIAENRLLDAVISWKPFPSLWDNPGLLQNVIENRFFDAIIRWKPMSLLWEKMKRLCYDYGEKPASTKFRMLHPDFMRYLKYNWLNSTRAYQDKGRNFRPTTGATMLLTALHTCDVTNAYGFITADHENYNNHCYESEWEGVDFVYNHDLQLEMNRWDKLDMAGILNLYRGKYRYRKKYKQ